MPLSKVQLRQYFNDIRNQMTKKHRVDAPICAAQIFAQQNIFADVSNIGCYLSTKNEFDSTPLIDTIWQAKKYCFLPVLTKDKMLKFVAYRYGDPLHPNRYAILEPIHQDKVIPPEELEIVITPLVAFDRHGNRLGTGGGYYDRSFAYLKTSYPEKASLQQPQQPRLIGLAYASQEAQHLPVDSWDISLDGVITEKEFIDFTK